MTIVYGVRTVEAAQIVAFLAVFAITIAVLKRMGFPGESM